MSRLSMYSLALLLVLGTSAALAEGRHHGGRGHDRNHHHKYHHRHHHRPYFYAPRHYPRYGYHHGYYYPHYLGAALVTSALTHSLYHTHQGAVCHQDHRRDDYRGRYSGDREVVGCHRIEQLPDGTERRVEVPLSECN